MRKALKNYRLRNVYAEPQAKEGPGRLPARARSTECALACWTSGPGCDAEAATGPRLHYTLTSLASDAIVMAPLPLGTCTMTLGQKARIFRELLPQEEALKPSDEVKAWQREKSQELYEDILHHIAPPLVSFCQHLPDAPFVLQFFT